MRKTLLSLVVTMMVLFFAAGCNLIGGKDIETSISLTDGLGRQVFLEEPADRIVSLSPSTTEILYAVGAGDQVVGRDSFSNYPEETLAVQDVGGSMGNYSYELITSLQPDLVVAAAINTPEQVNTLEELGITVYYLENPKTIEDLFEMIETMGTLSNHEEDAQDLTSSLRKRYDAVIQLLSSVTTAPVVFYELDGSDPARPWTPGPGSFMEYLITLAHGVNTGSALQSEWAQISIEEILVRDPQLIILGDSIYGTTAADVAARPGWDQLTAVQENRIYAFNDDLVSRPGPRMIEGLEELVKILHPELY